MTVAANLRSIPYHGTISGYFGRILLSKDMYFLRKFEISLFNCK